MFIGIGLLFIVFAAMMLESEVLIFPMTLAAIGVVLMLIGKLRGEDEDEAEDEV